MAWQGGDERGCLLIPAAVVLITIEEDVLHIPQEAGWASLVGLVVAFVLVGVWTARRRT